MCLRWEPNGKCVYKRGNWLEKSNGKHFDWRLYQPVEDRVYVSNYFGDDVPRIVWTAGGYFQDCNKVLRTEFIPEAETILGHLCDRLILYTKSDTLEYFYSSELGLDHRHFEECKQLHFNVWTSLTNAMPLKMVFSMVSLGKLKYTMTATSIQRMKIDDRVFSLPIKGMKTEPSWEDAHMEFIKNH